ncbi:MAG: YgiW/YdeI family stress tolerance OB fold protein [Plesiomonas sp.]|uniref:YgiW/YdeI family stress tolerance OB fold protein n=1 Tax=Plesiomonas sp. TaxID=2486279 RepID=UPI003F40477B
MNTIAIATVVLLLTSASAMASDHHVVTDTGLVSQNAYQGPVKTMTIAELQAMKMPFEDHNVVLEGYLTSQIDTEHYTFSDGKQQITVEVDHDVFMPQGVTGKTKVRLYGKYETGITKSELEAKRIQLL